MTMDRSNDRDDSKPETNGAPDNAAERPAILPAPKADPFDPANLRLTQNFGQIGGVRRQIFTVPVRKPTKEEFVRVHSDPAYTLDTLILELKDSRESYIIDQTLWGELATE